MRKVEAHQAVRAAARAYETALPAAQRKQLGQYFTGLPLGKLLAHLALDTDTQTVLDPMAGHGDLLDAVLEAATERGIRLLRLDGIEIDGATVAACRTRLSQLVRGSGSPAQHIIDGDAFDPASAQALPERSYELVITNPPYVRYQARGRNGANEDSIRAGLLALVASRLSGTERDIWQSLVQGYSGLSDLSVPAWLLAAALVRPGGRLALVVPATWRSRDYADVIRYILLRCFTLECIVEDQQPGWFSDALVRTHLIVARRLAADDIATPAASRDVWPSALWLQVAPAAAAGSSLVGAAFGGPHPEAQFAAWVGGACPTPADAITARRFPLKDEWAALEARIARRRWYRALETASGDLPLFAAGQPAPSEAIPDALRDILPAGPAAGALTTLEAAGVCVGQGLRTGCNGFFYVTACGAARDGMLPVEASTLFGKRQFCVPSEATRPVLRRQSELKSIAAGNVPDSRVLSLRRWVLPDDEDAVTRAMPAYAASGEPPPQIMPDDLAAYVRVATAMALDESQGARGIPQLSAVRTNVRTPRHERITPRFWYMLPDFAPRHLPAAFVARINNGLPWVESNCDPAILVDANFSTFWAPERNWTNHALKALLNSVWCRAFMEALGTPLGGGALKLEATHLRRMLVPILSHAAKDALHAAGQQLTRNDRRTQSRIDEIILDAVLPRRSPKTSLARLADTITHRAQTMSTARQRAA